MQGRFVGAGFGWGIVVGITSGLILAGTVCLHLIHSVATGPWDIAAFITVGALLALGHGVVLGGAGGLLCGIALAVTVGRTRDQVLALRRTVLTVLVVGPLVTWAALSLPVVIKPGDLVEQPWPVYVIPTVLGCALMSLTTRRIVRSRAVPSRSAVPVQATAHAA